MIWTSQGWAIAADLLELGPELRVVVVMGLPNSWLHSKRKKGISASLDYLRTSSPPPDSSPTHGGVSWFV